MATSLSRSATRGNVRLTSASKGRTAYRLSESLLYVPCVNFRASARIHLEWASGNVRTAMTGAELYAAEPPSLAGADDGRRRDAASAKNLRLAATRGEHEGGRRGPGGGRHRVVGRGST